MKNESKNKYSRRNSNSNKENPKFKTYYKKTNSSKKNNNTLSNFSKNKDISNLYKIENNNPTSSIKRKPQNKLKTYESIKPPDIYKDLPNKKKFDDWIWGKHSVFEALVSERAINRVWCTSEIFSSEEMAM